MLVSNSSILLQPPDIFLFIGNIKLKIIDNCVFMDVSNDNNKSKCNDHINQISIKVSKSIRILYKLQLIVPKNILTIFFID